MPPPLIKILFSNTSSNNRSRVSRLWVWVPSLLLACSTTLGTNFQFSSHMQPKELILSLLFNGCLLGKLSYILVNQFFPNSPDWTQSFTTLFPLQIIMVILLLFVCLSSSGRVFLHWPGWLWTHGHPVSASWIPGTAPVFRHIKFSGF